ncbi:alpha/beta hydrolase [Flavobacterium sp.]|uniref:alpha/beta hydrolase n=1 Tax=Flavobacterium sp. TaxID=239 RepID=UPI003B9A0B17
MSLYMISNREVIKDSSGIEQFSNDGSKVALNNFRIAECFINDEKSAINYTILEDSSDPDYQNVEKVLNGTLNQKELCGTEKMFYDLYQSMKNDYKPKSDVLFFIHGYQTTHEEEKAHMLKLKELYLDGNDFIEHLIYVSWPTSNSKVLTYWSDKDDSFITGQNLARIYVKLNKFFYTMFRKYSEENCKQRIHIMAHSMGNQVLKQMMLNLEEKYIVPLVDEVIILHADVSADSFNINQPLRKLQKLGQRTHIYIHKGDDALTISTATKNFTKRLGKAGPEDIANLPQSTFVIDVTDIDYDLTTNMSFMQRKLHKLIDHWGYLTSSKEINDINKILGGTDERRIENRVRHDIFDNYFYLNTDKIVNYLK